MSITNHQYSDIAWTCHRNVSWHTLNALNHITYERNEKMWYFKGKIMLRM